MSCSNRRPPKRTRAAIRRPESSSGPSVSRAFQKASKSRWRRRARNSPWGGTARGGGGGSFAGKKIGRISAGRSAGETGEWRLARKDRPEPETAKPRKGEAFAISRIAPKRNAAPASGGEGRSLPSGRLAAILAASRKAKKAAPPGALFLAARKGGVAEREVEVPPAARERAAFRIASLVEASVRGPNEAAKTFSSTAKRTASPTSSRRIPSPLRPRVTRFASPCSVSAANSASSSAARARRRRSGFFGEDPGRSAAAMPFETRRRIDSSRGVPDSPFHAASTFSRFFPFGLSRNSFHPGEPRIALSRGDPRTLA